MNCAVLVSALSYLNIAILLPTQLDFAKLALSYRVAQDEVTKLRCGLVAS